jgi:hypothetical protein
LAQPRRIEGDTAMGLLKADFYRFFALGFGAGALIVLATMGIKGAGDVANDIVPSAVAAPAAQ